MATVPIPANEAERLRALQQYEILDTSPEEAFDGLVRLACYICQTPIALITLVDSERQWFKARLGLEVPETPREVAFCAHAINRPNEMLIVPDALRDERFAVNPLVTGDPNIRFYAGSPLVTNEGYALGTLCVIDTVPRNLTPEQVDMLHILGQRVMAELDLRQDVGRLRQEVQAREAAEAAQAHQMQILAALYEASHQISGKLDLEALYAAAHTMVQRLMPAEVFVISLVNSAGTEVEDVYLVDRSGRAPNRRHALQPASGLGAAVILSGTPLRLEDWDAATAAALGAETFGDGRDTRSHLTVPLQANGRVIGAIGVQDYQPAIYTADHEQLLNTIGNQMAVAITNATLVQTIREDEQRFRTLVENIPEIFWLSDPQLTHFNYVSPAYERLWGRTRASLFANGRTYLEAIHPDDRERVAKVQQIEDQRWAPQEFRILQPDGQVRWVTAQAFPILDAEGRTGQIAGLASDITDRKLAAQVAARLAAIVTSTQDAIIGYTLEGRVSDWNPGAERLLGYTAAEMLAQPIARLAPPDRPDEVALLVERIARDEVIDTLETELFTKDRRRVPVSLSLAAVRDREGVIVGAAAVARDITDRKLLEQLRDDSTHMIVHDLRNPLAGTLLAFGALDVAALPPDQRELIEIAQEGTERVLDLVNTILDVERFESGELVLDRQVVRLSELVAANLARQAPAASAKQLNLVQDVPDYLPPVWIDGAIINRVLDHLVGDAIEWALPRGEIRVAAQVDRGATPNQLRVTVTDSGANALKNLQTQLFQKYLTGRSGGRGSGLGLVFCRLALEAHGGRIWVTSDAEQRTTFAFLLPLASEAG